MQYTYAHTHSPSLRPVTVDLAPGFLVSPAVGSRLKKVPARIVQDLHNAHSVRVAVSVPLARASRSGSGRAGAKSAKGLSILLLGTSLLLKSLQLP